jgi:MFS family permease
MMLSAGWHRPTATGVGLLTLGVGGSHALLGLVPTMGLALVAVFLLGAASGTFLASAVGVLQQHAGDGLRGRVMGFYSRAFLGTALVGGPLMGWIADLANPPVAFVVGGLCCAPAALLAVPALRHQRSVAADLPSR